MKDSHRRVQPGVVSPPRSVPDHIPRPPYIATGGTPARGDGRLIRTASEIERLRRAGRAAARVLDALGEHVRPGVTTDEVDAIVHELYIGAGGYPSTLGYRGFTKSLCTSVNEVVAHGIPDDRPLQDGDIVNCDVTIYLDGVHGDSSRTYFVGHVDDGTRHLVDTTEEALRLGIEAVRPGARVRDIGRAIQRVAEANGYGVVRELGGHDIGTSFHGPLFIPHYDDPRATLKLRPGMTFTIEPMLTMGDPEIVMWEDGWTIVTLDGQPSAQFEHMVLVTDTGVEVLTT